MIYAKSICQRFSYVQVWWQKSGFASGKTDIAFFMGRTGYGPKFRSGCGYELGYGFVVNGMGRSAS